MLRFLRCEQDCTCNLSGIRKSLLTDCWGTFFPGQSAQTTTLKVAHTGLQTLVESFNIQPPPFADFAKQVPRSDNTAADAAANWALDNKSFVDVRLEEVVKFLQCLSQSNAEGWGMLLSFDGAARGNPGAAAYGICGWWGRYEKDMFKPEGLLLQRAHRLGIGTNNCAEALGMASAIKTTLRFVFWVIQQLSHLALHPMR